MARQFSTASRTAQAQAHETTVGTSPILRIRTGAPPANCAAARTGTVLATINLPSDWASASAGALTKIGTWTDSSADATGTAGHYEIMDSGGTVCHEQGTVTASGGGGDMILTPIGLTSGQPVTVDTYTLTWGGA